jgi:hypothetical protein
MQESARILEEVISKIESKAAESINNAAIEFKKKLRSRTPSNRRKTRRYTTALHESGALEAFAGIIFPQSQRFESDGTYTEQLVSRVFEDQKQAILRVVEKSMRKAISLQTVIKVEIGKG